MSQFFKKNEMNLRYLLHIEFRIEFFYVEISFRSDYKTNKH